MTKSEVRLSDENPTIYITLERIVKYTPGEKSTAEKEARTPGIWLRLHNNTAWAISFSTDNFYLYPKVGSLQSYDGRRYLGLNDGIEVSIRYEVEATRSEGYGAAPDGSVSLQQINRSIPFIKRVDIASISWLPPGRSVLFKVSPNHLTKYLKIFFSFRYQWEPAGQSNGINEPEHRVYFYGSDLPENSESRK